MITSRSRLRAAAAVVLTIGLFATPAVSRTPKASLGDQLKPSLGRCGRVSACASGAVDGVLGDLRTQLSNLPRGARGPSAWLRQAAALSGISAASIEKFNGSPRDAILALYREANVEIDAALLSKIDAQLERAGAREAGAVGDLAGSLATAMRTAREATRGTGVERVLQDPVRAMHLITAVSSGLDAVTPETRSEYDAVLSSLARVDLEKMAAAALVLTNTIADTDAGVFVQDIDLPLISIGHDGDTTYSDLLLLQVDNSGNDTYLNNAGGMALAIDYGNGNDTYSAAASAQGSGTGAPGILYDEGGSDSYSVTQFGQGTGIASVGILYDAGDGADAYLSPGASPIATKAATLGGFGILVDEGGDDTLHQDGLDGFVYGAAGGTAIMANLGEGSDTYRSDEIPIVLLGQDLGKFTGPVQVSAEAGGNAILYEEGGTDSYVCGAHVRQGCQGAAGVGAFSLLWDLSGNDTYWMGESIAPDLGDVAGIEPTGLSVFPMGQGIGYGPSAPPGPGLGILRDEGGVDQYIAEKWAQGYASLSGLGLLYDSGSGADSYSVPAPFFGSRTDGSDWFDGTGGFGLDR